MKPPTSRRHCVNCDKITTFQYNRNVFHSECTICGFRFGIKKDKIPPKPKPKKAEKKIKLTALDTMKIKKRAEGKGNGGIRARKILMILNRDDFKCTVCGSEDKLTIHNNNPEHNKKKNNQRYNVAECVTLCQKCNSEQEQKRMTERNEELKNILKK